MVRMALDGRGDGAKPALREQLHILEGRLQRVQARGGAYAEVGLSMNVKMLLAKLEAGRVLSTGTH
jgi:hypothetical protein